MNTLRLMTTLGLTGLAGTVATATPPACYAQSGVLKRVLGMQNKAELQQDVGNDNGKHDEGQQRRPQGPKDPRGRRVGRMPKLLDG